jgi:hypothetical protein
MATWYPWARWRTCASNRVPIGYRNNVYLAADGNSQGAPGVSSGQATAAMERVVAGLSPVDAAVEACRLRLRPILMTSFGLFLTPVFFVTIELFLARHYPAAAGRHLGYAAVDTEEPRNA